jgi:hypothetical protein
LGPADKSVRASQTYTSFGKVWCRCRLCRSRRAMGVHFTPEQEAQLSQIATFAAEIWPFFGELFDLISPFCCLRIGNAKDYTLAERARRTSDRVQRYRHILRIKQPVQL